MIKIQLNPVKRSSHIRICPVLVHSVLVVHLADNIRNHPFYPLLVGVLAQLPASERIAVKLAVHVIMQIAYKLVYLVLRSLPVTDMVLRKHRVYQLKQPMLSQVKCHAARILYLKHRLRNQPFSNALHNLVVLLHLPVQLAQHLLVGLHHAVYRVHLPSEHCNHHQSRKHNKESTDYHHQPEFTDTLCRFQRTIHNL